MGESFSEVVTRFAGERSWNEVVGILSEDEAEDFENAIDAGRVTSRKRSDRLAHELVEHTEHIAAEIEDVAAANEEQSAKVSSISETVRPLESD